jgi:DNA-binding response OmpR family regulator
VTNPVPVSLETILLLDDDHNFRLMISKLLTLAGYKVVEAQSAMVATALTLERKPALAIVDYRLPGMNGVSWIQSMRQMGVTIPMVISTAAALETEVTRDQLKEMNIPLVIQKPIDHANFLDQVSGVLHGKREETNGNGKPHTRPDEQDPDGFMAELQRELDEAAAIYLQDTKKELAEVGRWVQCVDLADAIVAEQLRALAHKIRGTSGSYKLDQISKLAGTVEDLMRPASDGADDETEYLRCAVLDLFDELRRTLDGEIEKRCPEPASSV